MVPDQATGAAVLGKLNGQDQRWTTFAHRQDYTPTLFGDGLCGPLDRVEAFGAPGILHLQLWVGLAKFLGGLDSGDEGPYDHLHRLAVQFKLPPFGGFLQRITPRPLRMGHACSFVRLHTPIPDLCRRHLGRFGALELFTG